MPVPDLVLRPDPNSPTGQADLWAENTGPPLNGLNNIGIPFIDDPPAGAGIDPGVVDEDWMVVEVEPLGPGVSAASPASPFLAPDRRSVNINFTADGVTQATVRIIIPHSTIR